MGEVGPDIWAWLQRQGAGGQFRPSVVASMVGRERPSVLLFFSRIRSYRAPMSQSASAAGWLQRHRFLILAMLCAVMAVGLYQPGLNGGFFFDDKPNITENVSLYVMGLDHHSLGRAAMSFPGGHGLRSMAMLTFGLDYFRAGGFDPAAFKATNIAIHAISVVILACFLRELLSVAGWSSRRASGGALVVALAWAAHPLQVSSVLYVVQRMQTLATLFLILALWSYLRMRCVQLQAGVAGRYAVWTLVFWVMAMASKEDAILLPAYALALELCLFRFRAADPKLASGLRLAYLVATIAAAMLLLFWALPKYWSWAVFPGRDFNSYERMLTQSRVLVMYLGQIIWPAPGNLPFYYDTYPVSRGLLQPVTTLACWLLLLGLIASAVVGRRRPIFSLGIMLFFLGHVISSSMLGLELVFEHRNHFPLIGIMLLLADLADAAMERWGQRAVVLVFATTVLLVSVLGIATFKRSQVWGSNLAFAEESVRIAPNSSRAWVALCRAHFDLSQGDYAGAEFSRAIAVCERGGEQTGSIMALANVVIFKSIRGDASAGDWNRLFAGLRTAVITPENKAVAMNMVGNANHGIALDPDGVSETIEIVQERAGFSPTECVSIARFLIDHGRSPDLAYPYLQLAVNGFPPGDPAIQRLLDGLREEGLAEWATELAAGLQSDTPPLPRQAH